jgi:hypothetical protein
MKKSSACAGTDTCAAVYFINERHMEVTMRPLRYRHLMIILTTAVALMPFSAVLAKGPPAKVVISGPGISEATITDPALLEQFTIGRFESQLRIMDTAPAVASGTGYRVDRYLVEGSLWDTLTYYPDPEGGAGYIYYDGNKYPGLYAANRGLWFRASADGDAAMQQTIRAHQVRVDPRAAYLSVRNVFAGLLVLIGSLAVISSLAAQTWRKRKAAPAT